MKRIKRAAVVLVAAIMLFTLCGCETYNNFKAAFIDPPEDPPVEEVKTFKIGVLEPLSGSDSEAAAYELLGIQFAYELHPQEIDGVKIELVYADNKSDVEEAPLAAQFLVDQGVQMIIGSYKSIYTLASSDVISEAKIPAITASNTNPLITKTNNYYFRACYVDSLQGEAAADFALNKLNAEKVAVLVREGYDIGTSLASQFRAVFEEKRGEGSVSVYSIPENAENYEGYFASFIEDEVDAVYFPSQSVTAKTVISKARELGYDFNWLGTSAWSDLDEEGIYFTVDYAPDTGYTGEAGLFKKAYSLKYGNDAVASDVCALGYDAYLMIYNAIETAGIDASGQEYIDALVGIKDLQGATGSITMSGSGDPIKQIVVEQYENGRVHSVYTSNPHKDERSE